MRNKIIINIGMQFNRLIVLELIPKPKKHYKLLCNCIEKNIVFAQGHDLVKGRVKSCGCLSAELTAKRNEKHNLSKTSIYKNWKNMHCRCYNKNRKQYCDYGGRGIIVEESWHNFMNFYNDMNSSYIEGHTLDRIDNNKNYCKENCRWATKKEQAKNTRAVVQILYNDRWYFRDELAKLLNFSYSNMRKIEKKLPTKKLYGDE
jgi:hypothetical protein